MPDRRHRKGGESSALEVQADEAYDAVRGDHHRQEQQRAERSEAPLDFKLERGTEERRSFKQHGRIFHVIMVQEAETHCHEIITGVEQLFHVYQCAGQLILHITRAPHEEIQGTSI